MSYYLSLILYDIISYITYKTFIKMGSIAVKIVLDNNFSFKFSRLRVTETKETLAQFKFENKLVREQLNSFVRKVQKWSRQVLLVCQR